MAGRTGGSRTKHSAGYVLVCLPGHPRAQNCAERVYEHILVAERALGRFLPRSAQVHHVNGNKADNRSANLVICQDHAYHQMLHYRARALKECGHAGWLRCIHCKRWDAPAGMYRHPHLYHLAFHRPCENAVHAVREQRRREERKRVAPPLPVDVPDGMCQCGCGQPTEVPDHSDSANGDVRGRARRFLRGHNVRLRYMRQRAGA